MHPLTVMTWNVRYFGQKTGGLRATRRCIDDIARSISAMDPLPDVLALQEVEDRSLRGGLHEVGQLDRFRGSLNRALHQQRHEVRYRGLYAPAHRYALPGTPALYTTGLAVLLREDIEVQQQTIEEITCVRIPALSALKQKRIVMHVRLAVSGTVIDLFNTHLSLPAFFEGSPHTVPRRMGHGSNQLAEAQRVIDLIAATGGARRVLVGDLNSLPGSPVHQALTGAGLSDVFGGKDDMCTARFAHLRMHLDHIFASPDLHWQDALVPGAPFERLSDHSPKVVTLTQPR